MVVNAAVTSENTQICNLIDEAVSKSFTGDFKATHTNAQ